MVIELKADSSIARVETVGAELISLVDVFGQEYMWQKNADYWASCSPLLFPIAGNLRGNKTIINGKEYEMPKHGLCRSREFKVVYKSDCKVILNTTFDQETLKQYPYKFSITLSYSLTGGQISIDYTVMNLDEGDMQYCIGAHPAFNIPIGEGEFTDYSITFNKNESCKAVVYDLDKLHFDVERRVDFLKGSNTIPLQYDYFDNDAIVFEKINSNIVTLASRKTGRGVEVSYNGFDSIAFWTPIKKNAPFLCIEPWNGMGVRSNESDQFSEKFGLKTLKKDEQHSYSITIIPV